MAGNLSWDDKVDSILRQTGDNLEKLKDQLHSQSKQNAWAQPPPFLDTKQEAVGVSVHAGNASLPLTEVNFMVPGRHHTVQGPALRDAAAGTRAGQRENAPQCNMLLVHELTKRLNLQEMEIASLRTALAKVEERTGKHEGDICQLKGENSELRSRLADRGVHLTTESKFEQWRAQMTAEVQSLYTAVSAHRSTQQGRSADREDVVQLTHELHKNKISTSGDIHWLSQELRAVKTHLGQLELQVASLQCSIAQLQSDAEECKCHRIRQQDCSQQINHIRRDLDRLGRHSVHRERELVLRDRAQSIRGQDSSQRADSGDERGSEEQEGSVDEGQSFTSESSSSREGGSMTEDVRAISAVSLEGDSPVELSPSDNDTPTLQLDSESSSDCY